MFLELRESTLLTEEQKLGYIIGMDIVEVAPAYDVGEITALAASQLAMEMLYLYANRPEQ